MKRKSNWCLDDIVLVVLLIMLIYIIYEDSKWWGHYL